MHPKNPDFIDADPSHGWQAADLRVREEPDEDDEDGEPAEDDEDEDGKRDDDGDEGYSE